MKYEMIRSGDLFRIKALKDFSDVDAGDLGGLVDNEYNLSQEGDCWIYLNACALEDSRVFENAKIMGSARVSNEAKVYGHAKLFDQVKALGESKIFGHAELHNQVEISDRAQAKDNVTIRDAAKISGQAKIFNQAVVSSHAKISSYVKIGNGSQISVSISNNNQFKYITGYAYPLTITRYNVWIGFESYTYNQLDDTLLFFSEIEREQIKEVIKLSLRHIIESMETSN